MKNLEAELAEAREQIALLESQLAEAQQEKMTQWCAASQFAS
jgi:hypothetical protein